MTRRRKRIERRKHRDSLDERQERLARRRKIIREAKEFEDSIQPEFTPIEQDEIGMYQRKLQNVPEVKIVCWQCGKKYSGTKCPYCNAFKPRD